MSTAIWGATKVGGGKVLQRACGAGTDSTNQARNREEKASERSGAASTMEPQHSQPQEAPADAAEKAQQPVEGNPAGSHSDVPDKISGFSSARQESQKQEKMLSIHAATPAGGGKVLRSALEPCAGNGESQELTSNQQQQRLEGAERTQQQSDSQEPLHSNGGNMIQAATAAGGRKVLRITSLADQPRVERNAAEQAEPTVLAEAASAPTPLGVPNQAADEQQLQQGEAGRGSENEGDSSRVDADQTRNASSSLETPRHTENAQLQAGAVDGESASRTEPEGGGSKTRLVTSPLARQESGYSDGTIVESAITQETDAAAGESVPQGKQMHVAPEVHPVTTNVSARSELLQRQEHVANQHRPQQMDRTSTQEQRRDVRIAPPLQQRQREHGTRFVRQRIIADLQSRRGQLIAELARQRSGQRRDLLQGQLQRLQERIRLLQQQEVAAVSRSNGESETNQHHLHQHSGQNEQLENYPHARHPSQYEESQSTTNRHRSRTDVNRDAAQSEISTMTTEHRSVAQQGVHAARHSQFESYLRNRNRQLIYESNNSGRGAHASGQPTLNSWDSRCSNSSHQLPYPSRVALGAPPGANSRQYNPPGQATEPPSTQHHRRRTHQEMEYCRRGLNLSNEQARAYSQDNWNFKRARVSNRGGERAADHGRRGDGHTGDEDEHTLFLQQRCPLKDVDTRKDNPSQRHGSQVSVGLAPPVLISLVELEEFGSQNEEYLKTLDFASSTSYLGLTIAPHQQQNKHERPSTADARTTTSVARDHANIQATNASQDMQDASGAVATRRDCGSTEPGPNELTTETSPERANNQVVNSKSGSSTRATNPLGPPCQILVAQRPERHNRLNGSAAPSEQVRPTTGVPPAEETERVNIDTADASAFDEFGRDAKHWLCRGDTRGASEQAKDNVSQTPQGISTSKRQAPSA